MAATTATAPTPTATATAMATAAINVESPLSRLPAELLRLVLSHLGPKLLLRFGAASRAAAEAADADALWVALVRLAWQEESPGLLPAGGWRKFFRQMRQPPAIMRRGPKIPAECDFALALSDLLHRPLLWYSGSYLGEYRLLIEVVDQEGGSVLTRSLQPFVDMFAQDCWLQAGERASAVRTGVPGCVQNNELTGPGRTWLGDKLCRGDRLLARLCVEWGGSCVCLGAVPAVLHGHGCRAAGIGGADPVLKFMWRMPAVTVPDHILEYIHAGDSRSCDVMRLQCIESVLYIAFEPVGGTALLEPHSWKPAAFRLEAAPHFVHPRQGPSYHPLLPVSNQTVKERCHTDMMAMCFLYEAMRMRDRV